MLNNLNINPNYNIQPSDNLNLIGQPNINNYPKNYIPNNYQNVNNFKNHAYFHVLGMPFKQIFLELDIYLMYAFHVEDINSKKEECFG